MQVLVRKPSCNNDFGSIRSRAFVSRICLLLICAVTCLRNHLQVVRSSLWFAFVCCRYVGHWKQDKRHGEGCETLADGSQYRGQFVDGLKSGHGVMTASNGDIYEGDFQQGEMSGEPAQRQVALKLGNCTFGVVKKSYRSRVAVVTRPKQVLPMIRAAAVTKTNKVP